MLNLPILDNNSEHCPTLAAVTAEAATLSFFKWELDPDKFS